MAMMKMGVYGVSHITNTATATATATALLPCLYAGTIFRRRSLNLCFSSDASLLPILCSLISHRLQSITIYLIRLVLVERKFQKMVLLRVLITTMRLWMHLIMEWWLWTSHILGEYELVEMTALISFTTKLLQILNVLMKDRDVTLYLLPQQHEQ